MGIEGFLSFVKENQDSLLQPFQLKNCTLVVDGNNVFHNIYRDAHLDSLFGGDYRSIEEVCVKCFKTLLNCNVQPIVIFDGSFDNTVKWTTLISGLHSYIKIGQRLLAGEKETALPLFATNVFINVLKSLNIQVYRCSGDADKFIADVVNRLHCPVLSGDADFFVFDLKAGYILYDWNIFLSQNMEREFIETQIYYLDSLVNKFALKDRGVMPVFACLLGSDFVDGDLRKRVLRKIRNEDDSTVDEGRHKRVLIWLSNKTEREAIRDTILLADTENHESSTDTLEAAVSMYCCSSYEETYNGNIKHLIIETLNNLNFPSWLSEKYSVSNVPSFFPYLFTHRKIRIPILVEDFTRESVFSNEYCSHLRKVVYSVLLKPLTNDDQFVKEYIRDQNNSIVEVEVPLKNSYLSLDQVESMELNEKRVLYFDFVQLTKEERQLVESFPPPLQLFSCATVKWCSIHRGDNGLCPLIDGFIVGAYCLILDKYWSHFADGFFPSHVGTRTAILNVIMRYKVSNKLHSCDFGPSLATDVHCLSEWQAILYCLHCLNVTLNFPFENFNVENFYYGSLFYNLSCSFRRCNSFKDALENLSLNWRDMVYLEKFRNLFVNDTSRKTAGRMQNGRAQF